ncbi:Protein MtfA [Symmachiella dynata]|uniref:M90 family metallopeptidase n=1 Tax=Symmachiella dynata TaxID=2527995 RepID=UPI00118B8706|nr:M90 family metallopeptidase [Symmachiella dynata]QDT47698.1 Protein MtfA [Symmachiella dynata]
MLLIGSWWRNRRRRKLCAEPFPDVWEELLHRNAAFFSKLTPQQQAKLRDDLRVFIAEKDWEGCNGLKMSDEIQVTIAANACLLALELPEGMFDRVRTILVYPGDYVVPDRSVGPDGVVREGPSARHGEAWLRGPVILSWSNALEGGQNSRDGRNVVFHEFAHQLDMLDGVVDGMPPLAGKAQQQRWQQITRQAQAELHHDLRHGRPTLLDPYAATNAQEFFAVATECFFERSKAMRKRQPELYGLLSDYYRQDPAGRSGK